MALWSTYEIPAGAKPSDVEASLVEYLKGEEKRGFNNCAMCITGMLKFCIYCISCCRDKCEPVNDAHTTVYAKDGVTKLGWIRDPASSGKAAGCITTRFSNRALPIKEVVDNTGTVRFTLAQPVYPWHFASCACITQCFGLAWYFQDYIAIVPGELADPPKGVENDDEYRHRGCYAPGKAGCAR